MVKGYRSSSTERGENEALAWEDIVCESVGDVIEFWGFKRNHGRVWALLYLRNKPMPALSLQQELSLSKGAVSMITTDLEQWGVIGRVRQAGKQAWHYVAEDDFFAMIRRVLRDREISVIERVEEQLALAEEQARKQDATSEDALERLQRMRHFADTAGGAIKFLLQTLMLHEGVEHGEDGVG